MIKNVIITISLALSVTAIILILQKQKSETVYVDAGKLFSEFELSKKLNKDLEKVLTARKSILDSIYQKMRLLTIEVKAEGARNEEKIKYLAGLEEEYYLKQQEFDKDNKAATEQFMANIWNQLNQYVNDYGKQNNFTYVLGANGQGNIMYAVQDRNITDDLIQYVNNRYNDKIK
jgi:outer membrane protein